MPTPVPGWRPDPSSLELDRYWDGERWTERVRDAVTLVEETRPLGGVPAAVPASSPPAAPAPTAQHWNAGGQSGLAPSHAPHAWPAQPAWQPAASAPATQRRRPGSVWAFLAVIAVALTAAAILVLDNPVSQALGTQGYRPDLVIAAFTAPTAEPEPRAVEYPVYGSTSLVRYLESEIIAGETSIDVSFWGDGPAAEATLNDAMYEATTQNPYVFSRSWSLMFVNDRAVAIEPVYAYDADEVARRQAATLSAVNLALSSTGASAADPAASAVAIHDYVASIATYDYAAADIIATGGDTSGIEASQEAYGILVDGTAVCNGYAQAFQAIAQAAGLETVIVTGQAWSGATTGGHAWNRVLVDGAWLTVDATWDDAGDRQPVPDDFLLVSNGDPSLSRSVDSEWVVDSRLGAYGG